MQKIYFTLFFTAIFLVTFGQVPQTISYQTVIRNAAGAPVANGVVSIRVSIIQGSTTGAIVYQETHTSSTNANGLVSLSIGGGAVVAGSFSGINWGGGPYFIK